MIGVLKQLPLNVAKFKMSLIYLIVVLHQLDNCYLYDVNSPVKSY